MAAPETKAEDVVTDLSDSEVVTKYRLASDIVNKALEGILLMLKPGKKVVDICDFGDTVIEAQTSKIYKAKKKMTKGIAFPTCLSVNEIVCHYSPCAEESIELKEGDMVKIDIGAHIDGFIAVVAYTTLVGDGTLSGKAADVAKATFDGLEVATRMVQPGMKNTPITAALRRVADAYGVELMHGTLTHQLKQFVIDGNKVILQREDPEHKTDEITFEANEVYGVDVCMTSGDGKPKETDIRTTVFKRAADQSYRLKMKASRYVLNEVNQKFPALPFTVRKFDDVKQARMGVRECVTHGLINEYPVLTEKEGEFIAHYKSTVLLLAGGTMRSTGLKFPEDKFKSEKKLGEEEAKLVASVSVDKDKKKRKKSKKKRAAAAAAAAEGSGEGDAKPTEA